MQLVLSPYLWLFCLIYIDDIVIYLASYEDHIKYLDQVLEAIEKTGITFSPSKCHLFYPSIILLGHKVSYLELSMHEKKVREIMDLERSTKIAQLQTFLGILIYFSAFIPYYTSTCMPLFQLLWKNTKWNWSGEQERAFEEGKLALASAPVLAHPEYRLPYHLYWDTLGEALGCTLQQVQPVF